MSMSKPVFCLFCAAASAVLSLPAAAQRPPADPAAGFPSRPLRMIVPFAPQGPNDQLARMVGLRLTESWGQQVVVDNRPGAGTFIGTELAVRAPFILAGLGNALYDPALSALIVDITPPEHSASIMGLKSTAGSLGNLLGPALVVLLTPFVTPQLIFLLATGLVEIITLASGFFLRQGEISSILNKSTLPIERG